jgi:uncharacterized oxidoreductase
MNLNNNTILITGGATGIGLAMAEAFLIKGNTVIICGRRAGKLADAKAAHPALHTRVCDVGHATDRKALFDWVTTEFPTLNVLINNAGIQREIDFRRGTADLDANAGASEIAINFEGVVHLTALFMPHLMQQPSSAVVQISSGLALVPLVVAPVYSATKAALHSLSLSLRHQLRQTSVRVFEVLPPIVETDLDGGARERRGQKMAGISPKQVADETLAGLGKDELEIAVGRVKALRIASRLIPKRIFGLMNRIVSPETSQKVGQTAANA